MPSAIPGPAYRIVTSRLVIRCWHPADFVIFKEAIDANVEHLKTYLPWAGREPQDLQEKLGLLRRFRGVFDRDEDYPYGIFNLDETRVLGGTGLHKRSTPEAREIGYWIHKDFLHQGLATEVSAALTRVAFEVDQMNRVEIHCVPENKFSAAVPRKLGYTLEATLRERSLLLDERYHDTMVWTILRSEYPGSPSASAQLTAFDAAGRRIL